MQLRANLTSQHKCASRAPIISALPSPRVKLATLGSQRARVLARAKKGRGGGPGEEFLNGGEAYEIEFGKPAAPAEYWGKIANDSRSGMMEQLGLGSSGDVLMAGLFVASEDDAISTKTHIPLPAASYSKRLDNIAVEVCATMPADLAPAEQLAYVQEYLFEKWGLKLAQGMKGGEYSPYRVYLHHVLAQRCGTPASVAAVLLTLLNRLTASGRVNFGPTVVGIPSSGSFIPVAVEASLADDGTLVPCPEAVSQLVPTVRWVPQAQLLAEMLDQLKRFYWSWDWPLGAPSGFEACASALLGDLGRCGKVSEAVGVMQATGRPFGDVKLSVLAAERLAIVTREAFGEDSSEHTLQVRDYGTLLLHTGRTTEGIVLLERYQAWVREIPSRAEAAGALASLVDEIVLVEQKKSLDKTFSS